MASSHDDFRADDWPPRQALDEGTLEREARLGALLAVNFEGIIFSEQGRIIQANERFADIFGLQPADLIGRHIGELVAPEDRERVLANIDGHRESVVEHAVVTRDGERRFVEAHGRPMHYGGRVVRVTAVRDITERKRHQEQLHRLNRSLQALRRSAQALLRAADEAEYLADICRIIVEDCGHRMVWVGFAERDPARSVRPVACSGFEEGYLETLRISWADTPRGRGPTGLAVRTGQVCVCTNMLTDPAFEPWREQALRRGYASSIALPLQADGEVFGALTIYCTAPDPFSAEEVRLLTDLANDLAHGVQVLRLRAAHERSEAALREADRRKDEFLATLSHELRTPLSAIVGWSQMLLGGRLDEPTRRRAVEAIARNATAQSQIVNDVLDVSRIVQGKVVLEVKDVDLSAVLQQAIESVRHAIESKRLRLDVCASTDLLVCADPARLQQVFWNLLSNAAKFTPEDGVISVAVDRGDACVTVRITDTGIGIAREFLPCVFDRFSQADASASRKHPGLGLGLAIVRHLVELHGGTVKAESAGEGLGSTFTVTLPVHTLRQSAVRASGGPPGSDAGPVGGDAVEDGTRLDGVRILVVDDEADAREMVKQVLELRGGIATTAASMGETLDALHAGAFDVLVADIGMPIDDGYALIRQVRTFSTIPAVALTAYGREEDRARVLSAGYQQHLTKPAMPQAVVAAVASLVPGRGRPAR